MITERLLIEAGLMDTREQLTFTCDMMRNAARVLLLDHQEDLAAQLLNIIGDVNLVLRRAHFGKIPPDPMGPQGIVE